MIQFRKAALRGADFENACSEIFYLFVVEAIDGLELGEVLRAGENDAAKSGRGENKEEREVQLFGFGFAPLAEALVEGLLLGG